MEWIDIVGIVFVCVTMNHLGLVSAVETVLGRRIPVVDCPKCASFWSVLAYGLLKLTCFGEFIPVLTISFLASYMAIWLELLEGIIDTLYLKLYEKIYPNTTDNAAAADAYEGYSRSPLS